MADGQDRDERGRLTSVGITLIVIVIAGVVLAGVGPKPTQAPGFVAATIALVIIAVATHPRRRR